MIMQLLWGYLYVTSCASIVIMTACIAAARADQIRQRTTAETLVKTATPPKNERPQSPRYTHQVKQTFAGERQY